jgi:NAD-dependent dihydropyrimidine dehydrogenase PreA subunit
VAYIIAEPCIGTKDTACVDACPVDCIHPKKDAKYEDGRPGFEQVDQLFIDPVECIDCGASGDDSSNFGRGSGHTGCETRLDFNQFLVDVTRAFRVVGD